MKKFLIITSILFLGALPASAQLDINKFNFNTDSIVSLSDELSVDLIPTYPKPNSAVFVNLRMFTEDLNSAMITWSKDGKVEGRGRGLTNFNFTAGKAGSRTTIRISITLQRGVSFSKEVTIRPGSVDLLWQSDSYVPPFYRGKALFPAQGNILVSAEPVLYSGNSKISAARLIYKWTVDDQVLESQSGYGKNVAVITGPILGTPIDVGVLVTDPITNITADNFITINPVDPLVVFYENNPLYGIVYERALNNGVELTGEEMNVIASPFFLNIRDNILYSWRMNSKQAPEVEGLSATFRKPEGISGSTFLSLKAENQDRILQFIENGFKINYKNE